MASTSGERKPTPEHIEAVGAILALVGGVLLVVAAALVHLVAGIVAAGVLLGALGLVLIRLAAIKGGGESLRSSPPCSATRWRIRRSPSVRRSSRRCSAARQPTPACM